MTLRRLRAGFTLIEVVIAAGLLAGGFVLTAMPVRNLIMSSVVAGDRATAVYWALAGLEYQRGQTSVGNLTSAATLDTTAGAMKTSSNFPAPGQGVVYSRNTEYQLYEAGGMYVLRSRVSWSRYGRSHNSTTEKPVDIRMLATPALLGR